MKDCIVEVDQLDKTLRVCDFAIEDRRWDWDRLKELVPNHILHMIAAIMPPSVDMGNDWLAWKWRDKDAFSSSMTYKLIFSQNTDELGYWKKLWRVKAPHRVRAFLWLLWHGTVMTNSER